MPRIIGDANIIGKTSWQSDQNFIRCSAVLRPAFDHDARPLKTSTNVLEGGAQPGTTTLGDSVLGYYDLDLGVVARPVGDVRVAGIFNVGNYVSSYRFSPEHGYDTVGADEVRPYKVFINVPFKLLGSNEITLGRQGTQLTPYTFWAIDPDTYTYIPREDSGEVVFWGINTAWRFGNAKVRWFAGVNPEDGRLQPLNVMDQLLGTIALGTGGNVPIIGATNTFGEGNDLTGRRPIGVISNMFGARLTFGEPDVIPYRATALPVGTAEQLGIKPDTLRGREVSAEAGEPAAVAAADQPAEAVESGMTFGPFRNVVVGLNYLIGTGRENHSVEDARAQVYGGDARFKLGPIRVEGEAAFGQSDTGGFDRPRALDASAWDVKGFWGFGLGDIADFEIGGGYKRIELDYLVPGYWGLIGAWKNPRGIQGPVAEVRVPLKWNIASFFRNIVLKASGEWYRGINVRTLGTGSADPEEDNLRIDRYLAGLQFALTSRNTVGLGVEQVYRNYVAGSATDAPLALPTAGFGGSPLVGTRIKNTETYINLGVGHNFTPDIALQLLYQVVDFAKYTADRSNQPANYRGYVATAQVGVRF